MRVLIISPTLENVSALTPKPPLGIAYIASMLEKKGNKVKILDMYSKGLQAKDLLKEIESFEPGLVCFSVLTPYMNAVAKYSQTIKEKFKKVKIAIGGPHPSALPERSLEEAKAVDFAIFGEGEQTSCELAEVLEGKHSLESIDGLAFRKGNKIITNKPRKLIVNLDRIPFPAWHLLDMETYITSLGSKRIFYITATRGCPGRCVFCDSHRIWGRNIRSRSVENIIKELRQLKEKYRIEYFVILDDTFTISTKRVEEFCNALASENLGLTWECKGRVNLISKQLLEKMAKAGCKFISYGGESGSQEVLNYIKKGITIEQIRNAVKWTKEAGMRFEVFWMMGFPIETEEHIRKTFELAKELGTEYCSYLNVLVPYPGTDIYPEMKKEGLLLSEDWEKYFKSYEHAKTPEEKYIMPAVRTRFLSAEELLVLSKKFNTELERINRRKIIVRQAKRIPQIIAGFLKNPKAFSKRAGSFVKKYVLN